MMKSVVVSFLLVAVCLSIGAFADEKDHIGMKETIRECARERNIDPDELKALMPPKNDAERYTLNCVATCTLEKKGLIKDGKLQEDKMEEIINHLKDHLSDENVNQLIDETKDCAQKAQNATGECAVGGSFVHCFLPKLHRALHGRP